MILSFEPTVTAPGLLNPWAPWAGAAASAIYALWAFAPFKRASMMRFCLALAWALHTLAIVLDVAEWRWSASGGQVLGARSGFAPSLSIAMWVVVALHAWGGQFLAQAFVRRLLALTCVVVLLLAASFPGESRPLASSPWAPLHWALGLASYGLCAAAVLHALLQRRSEQRLRAHRPDWNGPTGGVSLLALEALTFRLVWAAFVVLSLAVLLGLGFMPQWRWDHKTVFSLLGWLVLAALLLGRHRLGWRGALASRWLYAAALCLLLSYAGSRFVLEVILQRPVG